MTIINVIVKHHPYNSLLISGDEKVWKLFKVITTDYILFWLIYKMGNNQHNKEQIMVNCQNKRGYMDVSSSYEKLSKTYWMVIIFMLLLECIL